MFDEKSIMLPIGSALIWTPKVFCLTFGAHHFGMGLHFFIRSYDDWVKKGIKENERLVYKPLDWKYETGITNNPVRTSGKISDD